MEETGVFWTLSARNESLILTKIDRNTASRIELPPVESVAKRNGKLVFLFEEIEVETCINDFIAPKGDLEILEGCSTRDEFLILLRAVVSKFGLSVQLEDVEGDEIGATKYKHLFCFEKEVQILRVCHPERESIIRLDARCKQWQEDACYFLKFEKAYHGTLTGFFREAVQVSLLPKAVYDECVRLMRSYSRGLVRNQPGKEVTSTVFRELVGCKDYRMLKEVIGRLNNRVIDFPTYTEELVAMKRTNCNQGNSIYDELLELRQEKREWQKRERDLLDELEKCKRLKRLGSEEDSIGDECLTEELQNMGQRSDSLSTVFEMEDLDNESEHIEESNEVTSQIEILTATRLLETRIADSRNAEVQQKTAETTIANSRNAEVQQKTAETTIADSRNAEVQQKTAETTIADSRNAKVQPKLAESNINLSQLKVGDNIKAEENGHWFDAQVMDIGKEKVRVHWKSYSKAFDCWIERSRIRIIEVREIADGEEVEAYDKKYNQWYSGIIVGKTKTGYKVHFPLYNETKTYRRNQLR